MDWIFLLISLISGSLLSMVYFGGLWITVKRITGDPDGVLWIRVMLGYLIRTIIVLAGFYLLLRNLHWAYLALALLSFVITRQVIVKMVGEPAVPSTG